MGYAYHPPRGAGGAPGRGVARNRRSKAKIMGKPVRGPRLSAVLLLVLAVAVVPAPAHAEGELFVVDSVADDGDATPTDGLCRTAAGGCTLRAAVKEAERSPGPTRIEFAIPGEGPHTIALTARLTITEGTGPTVIDGYTQPGAAPNTDPLVSNARLQVEVEGQGPGGFDAFAVSSGGNELRGLAIYNVRQAVALTGAAATGNRIVGNFLGTDATGTHGAAQTVLGSSAVVIRGGAAANQVGDVAPADRNVISGNAFNGVAIADEGSVGNVVYNNLIGLSPDGAARLHNANHGVDIGLGASDNVVGGTQPGQGNVVSGNNWEGVELSHGVATTGNAVVGNFIGTDVTGTQPSVHAYNGHFGVRIKDGPSGNRIEGNVIGNNHGGGIEITTSSTRSYSSADNVVRGNRIGVALDGTPLPNSNVGIEVAQHATGTQIGPDNVIAHNPSGVRVSGDAGTDFHTITRNSIYANAPGLGIDLAPFGVANALNALDASGTGANQSLNAPLVAHATTELAAGTACPGCTVEVFVADRPDGEHGEGRTFVGSAVAGADRSFTVTVAGPAVGEFVTATATDAVGNTSEFSLNRSVLPAGAPPPVDVERLAGETRVQTAIAVSRARYPDGSDRVVLARADAYPDALTGGPLAAAVDAPILLTQPGELHPDTAAEITRLGATGAYLLGGPSALSELVREQLVAQTAADTVVRLGGATRFDTAVGIAGELLAVTGAESTTAAYLAEGANADPARGWPDALSVSALAAFQGAPILLATRDALPEPTAAALEQLGVTDLALVGGPAAIANGVANAAEAAGVRVERLGGADRFDTSRILADRAMSIGMDPASLWLAAGHTWPDALSGGPAAAGDGGVLLLVSGADLAHSRASGQWLTGNRPALRLIRILGGTAAISAAVEEQLG